MMIAAAAAVRGKSRSKDAQISVRFHKNTCIVSTSQQYTVSRVQSRYGRQRHANHSWEHAAAGALAVGAA